MRFTLVTRLGIVVAAVVLTGAAGTTAYAAPTSAPAASGSIAQLEREVGSLEERYDGLQERYRGSIVEQHSLDRQLRSATSRVASAQRELELARMRLTQRAVALYQDSAQSDIAALAASGSFSNLFDRLDAARRISASDSDFVGEVRTLESTARSAKRKVAVARERRARITRRVAADAMKMRKLLAQRTQALETATAEARAAFMARRQAAVAAETMASRARVRELDAGGESDAGVNDSRSESQGAAGSAAPASDASSDASSDAIRVPLPPASGAAAGAAQAALSKVGRPYVWAAAGPDSFDCSGLVVWAFAQVGRGGLPHSTYSLITMGVEVPLSQAQVGDLVFTNNTGHMGIYVGGGQMVHAPRTGRTVSVEPLTYYSVVAVRRI